MLSSMWLMMEPRWWRQFITTYPQMYLRYLLRLQDMLI